MPTVSAIITTHNRSHLLARAVDSVLNQTYRDFELIVVDDASSDDTPEIMKRYDARGDVTSIRISESRGANHARNQGANAASGEYLAYLDDDDLWLPTKLERQANALESAGDVALVGAWFHIRGRVQRLPGVIPYGRLLSQNVTGSFSNCMFRKMDLVSVGGMDESLRNAQDWDLWLKLGELGKVVVVPECLVRYNTEETDRISVRADRSIYYGSYMAVVRRHQHKMGTWQRLMHYSLAGYHTTPSSNRIRKAYMGIYYQALHGLDRMLAKVA